MVVKGKTKQRLKASSKYLHNIKANVSKYEEALRRRNFPMVCWMIDSRAIPVDYKNCSGDTALTIAAAENCITSIQLFLNRYFI